MSSILQLCKLSGTEFKHGSLIDWQKNLYLPLETRRAVFAPGHQRWKRENFNSKVYSAWDEKGLYFTFAVRARAPQNQAADNALWNGDCMEIMLDVRKNPTAAYEKNTMHLCIAPPCGEKPGRYMFANGSTSAPGFEIHSFLTADGWGGTALIPWSAFDDFTPEAGTEIGLGLLLGDAYGRKNNNPFFSAQYLCFGSQDIPRDATALPRWRLTEKFTADAGNDFANLAAVDLQKLLMADCINAPLIMAEPLKKLVKSVTWHCELGNRSFDGVIENDFMKLDLPDDCYGDGCVDLIFYGDDSAVLGTLKVPFCRIDMKGVVAVQKQVSDLIQALDWSKLGEENPDKLAGLFGLLNNYEQLKRVLFLEDISQIGELLEEMSLRLELLQSRAIKTGNALFDLLKLSGNDEAQITVEYPRYHPNNRRKDDCLIKFHAGGIVLAKAHATLSGKKLDKALIYQKSALYHREMMPVEDKSNLLFTCQIGKEHNQIYLIDPASLYAAEKVDAVVIAENAPEAHKLAACEYAQKHNVPIVEESALVKDMRVLYAGRPAEDSALGKSFAKVFHLLWAVPGRNDWVLETENGLRIVIRCISAEGCRLIAEAIAGTRVFGKNESIMLAKLVAAELAKLGIEPMEMPENGDLVAADIHCHTIYSDGLLTPLGLIAAAMYSQMDFLMIADHETADGVLDTVKLFEEYQWKFPLLCAEENSLPDGHFNSYPVTESIMPNLPLEELLAVAHAQGALVQYNHPATYSNRRDLQANGIAQSIREVLK